LHAVALFRARHGARLEDPGYVRERCVELSEEFLCVCEALNLPAGMIDCARFGEDDLPRDGAASGSSRNRGSTVLGYSKLRMGRGS
jgi:hypothetical protein